MSDNKSMMEELHKDDHKLNKLKQEDLKILKAFIKICEEYHLHYFIIYGSFLGAVRHQGFIPWDDDIDVAMPRPDYEKFFEIADSVLPDDLYASSYKNGDSHVTVCSKLCSKKKEFTLNTADEVLETGAWIDINAIDGAPNSIIGQKIFKLRFVYRRGMCQLANFSRVVNLKRPMPWYQNAIIKLAQISKIENRLDSIKQGEKYHKLLSSIPYETAEKVASFQGDWGIEGVVDKEVYGKGKLYQFEDIMVVGPVDYDTYLKAYYGDWRTPPSQDNRNIHGVEEKE